MKVTKQAQGATPRELPQVTREEVKTLAIAVGVREAARQLNLSESTVKSWSTRDKWFVDPPKPLTVLRQNKVASNASISPSDALRTTLTERSNATKLGLSKAAMKASEHLADAEPEQILKQSRAMRDIAATASTVHGWEAGGKDTGPFSPQSIQILSQRTYLNVGKGNEEND